MSDTVFSHVRLNNASTTLAKEKNPYPKFFWKLEGSFLTLKRFLEKKERDFEKF